MTATRRRRSQRRAIVAEGLRKRFGRVVALDGVDLEVQEGSVLGLLGPNGAGKTTIVRVLTTLLQPDGGRAEVLGYDVVSQSSAVRRLIGLTGQSAAVENDLTPREFLRMIGRLSHMSTDDSRRRADELVARFRLEEIANRRIRTLSGGMQRRVDVAGSLVGNPQVLFLDEPTTGLDLNSRLALWGVIDELVGDGSTVLLTTQYLEEADRLVDRINVIDHGRVIAEGTPSQLKRKVGMEFIDVDLARKKDARPAARALEAIEAGDVVTNGSSISVPVSDGTGMVAEAVRRLDRAGIQIVNVNVRRPTLDDVFVSLTGRHTEGEE